MRARRSSAEIGFVPAVRSLAAGGPVSAAAAPGMNAVAPAAANIARRVRCAVIVSPPKSPQNPATILPAGPDRQRLQRLIDGNEEVDALRHAARLVDQGRQADDCPLRPLRLAEHRQLVAAGVGEVEPA